HVAVLVPPALGIGAGDEPEEGVALLGVIDSVQLEQVVDVALFEADLAEFHAADLGVGGTDLVTGVVTGNALLLAKAPELGPEEGVALLGVIDSVQLEQVVDVALFEADLAEFHAADLGVGGTDLVTGVVTGNALLLAKAPELGPEENTQHGRAAAGLGEKVLGDLQILRVIGDHDASLWLLLAGTTAQYIHEEPRWAGDGRFFL